MRLGENSSTKKDHSSVLENDIQDSKVIEFIKLSESLLNIFDIRVSFVNPEYKTLLYSSTNSQKIIGYTLDDFKTLDLFGYIHPDDRDMVSKKFKNFRKK